MSDAAAATATGRRVTRATVGALVTLRWWVIGFWVLVCAGSWFVLPSLGEGGGGNDLRGLVPVDTPAVATELQSVALFGFPLMGRTVVVQRDPDRLSVFAQARTVVSAVGATRRPTPGLGELRGALPITNTLGAFPGSEEQDTTALTYLLFEPDVSLGVQTRTAKRYAERFFGPNDAYVGVTGSVPARAKQGDLIRAALPSVELFTLGAIVTIVGVALRSVVAPLVSVVATAVAYVLVLRLSGAVAAAVGVATPSELEPVIVALLLGIVTDYTVFFLGGLRRQLAEGRTRLDAAREAGLHFVPIVAVAGLAVAAGCAALLVAQSPFFRALGPALVFTVVVGLLVAVTLVPAAMAVLGRWCFWPGGVQVRGPRPGRRPSRLRSAVAALARSRRRAGLVVAGSVLCLAAAALPLLKLGLGVSFVGSLPEESGVRTAADAARSGFADGILSPSTVLLQGAHLDRQGGKLALLEQLIETQPGVAGVLGPGDLPRLLEKGVLVNGNGTAARLLVILGDPALGADGISTVASLQGRLPILVAASGLRDTSVGIGGDTAAAAYIVQQTKDDMLRIALAALAANFLMLVLFLRAPVAALALLAGSVLTLAASLGITSLLFGHVAPGAGLTFYVPFAAAVMLLAFGSDYNIYAVGNIWEATREKSLPEAITTAMPGTVVALTVAGLALAASFGLLAVVPLLPFRQLAFVMFLGILLDVLVVRSLLVPALLTLFGRYSAWPSRRLMRRLAHGTEDDPTAGGRHPDTALEPEDIR